MGHSAILQLLSMNASPVKPSQELFVVYRIRGSVYLWRNQYRGYRQRRQMCPWYVKHVRVGQTEGPSYCLILSYCLCCQSYLCTHGTSAAQKRYFLFGLRRKQLLRAHDCCSKEFLILFDQYSIGNKKFMQSQKLKTKFAACGSYKYWTEMGNPIHSGENM